MTRHNVDHLEGVSGMVVIRRSWFWWFFVRFILFGTLIGLAVIMAGYWYYGSGLPDLQALKNYKPSLITRVYSREGNMLGEFFLERREFVSVYNVPPTLIGAFIAIEDGDFYDHLGIDPLGILRAAYVNLKAGRVVQGASTITQQVVKIFLLTSERSFERKFKEMILALQIEQELSKEEILELYLNEIYLGAGSYGISAAARVYFDRKLEDLSLAQMAMLAGLPKAPSTTDPRRHFDRAKRRQELVLSRMVVEGFITQKQATQAGLEELYLRRPRNEVFKIGLHYVEHIRRSVKGQLTDELFYREGLEIYSPISAYMQIVAQEAIKNGLIDHDRRHGYRGRIDRIENSSSLIVQLDWVDGNRAFRKTTSGYFRGLVLEVKQRSARVLLSNGETIEIGLRGVMWARKAIKSRSTNRLYLGKIIRKVTDVLGQGDVILVDERQEQGKATYYLAQEPVAEAALISMHAQTGDVLAMVGGYNFERSEFNRATQGERQPGSAFKPFVYAAALDGGMSPVTRIDDSPTVVEYFDARTGKMKLWRAENYEQMFYGPTTLRVGLVHSRNLVSIRLLRKLGMKPTLNFLSRFGIDIPKVGRNLSLALGATGRSVLEMARGYAVFANNGRLVRPSFIHTITDRNANILYSSRGGECILCSPGLRNFEISDDMPSGGVAEVITPETAFQITSLLEGVILHGTGKEAKKIGRALAGKTGTTNSFNDAWFIGYSPAIVTAVWVGMDDFSTLGDKETGARAALPIWTEFMGKVLKRIPETNFVPPSGIRLEEIDAETGTGVTARTELKVMEAFKEGQIPHVSEVAEVRTVLDGISEGFY